MSATNDGGATLQMAGIEIPRVGLGTWELDTKEAEEAVRDALEIGYRHIDTARAYENEDAVGKAIAGSEVDRSEIFLTTKLWFEDLSPESVRSQAEGSLKQLDTGYVDLLLIHWPNPDADYARTFAAMSELQQSGKVRHIGVSNFPTRELEAARACSESPIAANQVEFHPYLDQSELLKMTSEEEIVLEAYSPLASGQVPGDNTLAKVGEKYGKSAPQVSIRWLIDHEQVVALPRSSSHENRVDNFDVFDFSLDDDDRRSIDALASPDGRQIDPDFAPEWD